jgi:hypothetical protein
MPSIRHGLILADVPTASKTSAAANVILCATPFPDGIS